MFSVIEANLRSFYAPQCLRDRYATRPRNSQEKETEKLVWIPRRSTTEPLVPGVPLTSLNESTDYQGMDDVPPHEIWSPANSTKLETLGPSRRNSRSWYSPRNRRRILSVFQAVACSSGGREVKTDSTVELIGKYLSSPLTPMLSSTVAEFAESAPPNERHATPGFARSLHGISGIFSILREISTMSAGFRTPTSRAVRCCFEGIYQVSKNRRRAPTLWKA